MRPSDVATSIIGSSQNRPREPVRTISTSPDCRSNDAVASLLRQSGDVEVVRTGLRGLFWLEPMVEVATSEGRIAYGPVTVADISGLLGAGMLVGGPHPLRLGRPEELPFLAKQTRLTFARCGIVDPLSLDDYRAHGGLKRLAREKELGPEATVEMVTKSGLR